MKYRVIAHSRDNGQRMTLELDAASKLDAERSAKRQNLNIIRIEPADPAAQTIPQQQQTTPQRPRSAFSRIIAVIVVVAILAALAWLAWPSIQHLFESMARTH